MDPIVILAGEFHQEPARVKNVVQLVDAGNTIPFIARYRKELTGSMDDQLLRQLAERLKYLRGLDARRQEIAESIRAQGKLTDELARSLDRAETLTGLEDLYRPYRPKRRTRAGVARSQGLEPLAALIRRQKSTRGEIETAARACCGGENRPAAPEDAIQGALDILAEGISDDAALRGRLRQAYRRAAVFRCRAAKEEDSVYRMYYDYREPAARIPGHRILAADRGEREGYLKITLELPLEGPLATLREACVRSGGYTGELMERTIADVWQRLLAPSLEREIRSELTDRAQRDALTVFGANLRQLLLQPPVRGKTVLGLDPAYRTGCKTAVVDPTGRVLETAVIYPTPPHPKLEEAKAVCRRLITRYGVEVVAIGNGTASRETEIFAAGLLKELGRPISYMVVSEAGASVYSASKLGAEEFPDFDVSLRSAVSIARRLQDPLAELVKIDPKAIGVGQYQHDLPEAALDETLGGVVESCVNSVGVDLNTASASLLSHVAGIGAGVAKAIVTVREANGPFRTRRELLGVPRLGPKAFEQCAGFLRIPDGENVLDRTGVHPESYAAARKLLTACGFTPADAAAGRLTGLRERVHAVGESALAGALAVGLPTLHDMVEELLRPGRDPRDELPAPLLRTDILEMADLKPGMELKGTVRNVVDFGAFVDIGVHQDGLVHVSQLSDRFVRRPSEVVHVGDIVTVRVLEVDPDKKRIALTMRSGSPAD